LFLFTQQWLMMALSDAHGYTLLLQLLPVL